jgi:hypothetical protein
MTTTEAVLRISGYKEPEAQRKMILSKAIISKNFFYFAPQQHLETLTLAVSASYTV